MIRLVGRARSYGKKMFVPQFDTNVGIDSSSVWISTSAAAIFSGCAIQPQVASVLINLHPYFSHFPGLCSFGTGNAFEYSGDNETL